MKHWPVEYKDSYIPFSFSLVLEELKMLERKFQSILIKSIKERLPGCEVLKNDSTYLQGVPDLIVLYGRRWAMLECKRRNNSRQQPNQKYYVDRFREMSYANFITPENQEEILDEMEHALRS